MKRLVYIMLPLALSAGILNSAKAQRSHERGSENRENRSSGVSAQRSGRDNFSQRMERNTSSGTRNGGENRVGDFNRTAVVRNQDNRLNTISRSNTINNNRNLSANEQRNNVALSTDRDRRNSYATTQQRVYRDNNFSREQSTSRTVYNNYNYNNSYYRGGYYPHFYMGGPRYTRLPRSFITINFGGYPYYYNDGLFYGSYNGYYQPLFPPPGISVRLLPFGYRRIFIGADLFYYYNGIFYRHHDKDYEVVDAPMGATVSSLPKGAKSVTLNGEKLYELNGTYFKEDRNYKGETVYTVVGKNGEVNNTNGADNNTPPVSLNPGDEINQLPDGSKIVTINGERLYVTPDETYLKEETDGNITRYKVVGK